MRGDEIVPGQPVETKQVVDAFQADVGIPPAARRHRIARHRTHQADEHEHADIFEVVARDALAGVARVAERIADRADQHHRRQDGAVAGGRRVEHQVRAGQ